jgi:hypothetical protein
LPYEVGTVLIKLQRLALAALLVTGAAESEPVRVLASNPHYLEFNGKPILLITSAEHYGGVVNGDFDYVRYFDALKSYGLNYTRIYPGFLFEPMGKFVRGNTLGPKPASLVLPWARSDQPGYPLGGNKFDLDKWNPAFFTRLKDFIAKAAERNIVVEICFFNAQYSDTWPMSPLYAENNIQGEGNYEFEDAQTITHADLTRRESDYVRKITEEVNGFDNVVLEICDEPFLTGTPIELAGPWIGHMLQVILDAESNLPKKHLVAQQIEGPLGGPCDFTKNPKIPMIVTQYLFEAGMQQMGGLQALDRLYELNKPIEENETDYYPIWYKGDKIADSRVEAWEFMVGGGAGFNQLNGLFTVKNPAGEGEENAQLLGSLRNLKQFLESFDFARMRQDKKSIVGGLTAGAHVRGISEPGRQYAFYMHHAEEGTGSAYKVVPGKHQERVVLNLPRGAYKTEWVDPSTGSVVRADTVNHNGGNRELNSPSYTVDIALRIVGQAATAGLNAGSIP